MWHMARASRKYDKAVVAVERISAAGNKQLDRARESVTRIKEKFQRMFYLREWIEFKISIALNVKNDTGSTVRFGESHCK